MSLEGLTEKRSRLGVTYLIDEASTIVAKQCTGCRNILNVSEFHKSSKGLAQRASKCSGCASQEKTKWYEENPEYNKTYYVENKEKLNKRSKENHIKNRERYLMIKKRWREGNLPKKSYMDRLWRERNINRKRNNDKKWVKNNPEKVAMYRRRRYTKRRNLPSDLTLEEYRKTLDFFNNRCALSGRKSNLEVEHAIPISIGHGGTTLGNCYPISNGLNQSKNNSNIFEWFEANRQRFNLEQSRFDRLIEWLGKANGMTVEEYRDYVYWCHANPRSIDELKAQ